MSIFEVKKNNVYASTENGCKMYQGLMLKKCFVKKNNDKRAEVTRQKTNYFLLMLVRKF